MSGGGGGAFPRREGTGASGTEGTAFLPLQPAQAQHMASCLAPGRVGQGRRKAWRLDPWDSKAKGERKGFSSRLNVNS